jgi:hypothetical protein
MTLRLIAFLTCCVVLSCQPTSSPTVALSQFAPVLLQGEGPIRYQYWEIPQAEEWWEPAGVFPTAVQAFRDSLRLQLGDSLFAKVVSRQATQRSPQAGDVPFDSLNNAQRVHQGGLGKVHPISKWEAQVLNEQLSRYPLLGHPTEFHCFVVQNPDSTLLRLYFAASDQPFPPSQGPLVEHFEPLLAEGWQLIAHLHNHYESDSTNYLGITAPSQADAHFYKGFHQSLGLREARITNGFHTVVLPAAVFGQFRSH